MVVAKSIYKMNIFSDDHFGEAISTLKESIMDKKLTPEQNLKLIQAVGGTEGAHQVIAGSKMVVNKFPTIAVVKIGKKHRAGPDPLPTLLEKNGVSLHRYARLAMSTLSYKVVKVDSTSIELIRVCPSELGLSGGASQEAFFARALEYRLGMCPHETATAFLRQHGPDWLLPPIMVASKPIAIFADDIELDVIFAISTGRIDTVDHNPKQFISSLDSFLFMRL
jgi:hypothetical protein